MNTIIAILLYPAGLLVSVVYAMLAGCKWFVEMLTQGDNEGR